MYTYIPFLKAALLPTPCPRWRPGPLRPCFVMRFYSSRATGDGTRAGHLTHDQGHSDPFSSEFKLRDKRPEVMVLPGPWKLGAERGRLLRKAREWSRWSITWPQREKRGSSCSPADGFPGPGAVCEDWLCFLHCGSIWPPCTVSANLADLELGAIDACLIHPKRKLQECTCIHVDHTSTLIIYTHTCRYHLYFYMIRVICKGSRFKTVMNTKTWPLLLYDS